MLAALPSWTTRPRMFLAGAGVALPVCLAAACALLGVTVFRTRLKTKRGDEIVAAIAVLASVPYAASIASYTFSGPQALLLRGRSALMAAEGGALAVGIGAFVWLFLRRRRAQARSRLLGAAGLACGLAALGVSQYVRPNQFLRLHSLLGYAAVLSFGGGLTELLRGRPQSGAGRRAIIAPSLAVLYSVVVLASVPKSDAVAWILEAETAFARYTGPRLGFGSTDGEAESFPVAPAVESEQVREWKRKKVADTAPNVVLFFIDNVQQDHVGAYGYARKTTPNFDALAEQGAVFEHAYSVWPQTRNFMCMFLLGRYVPGFNRHDFPPVFKERALTRLLKERGYRVFVQGFFEDTTLSGFRPEDYAIDAYYPPPIGTQPLVQREVVLFEQIAAHLEAAKAEGQPAFVWVHLIQPHWKDGKTFRTSPEHDFGPELEDLYDSAIAGSDAWLGHMRELLETYDSGRPTVWIAGSDHGAGLPDYREGKTLLSVHTRVPLVIVAPGIEPRRIPRPVRVPLDLGPTLLDVVGVPTPESFEGTSLLADILGESVPDRPFALSYYHSLTALIFGRWKLLRREKTVFLAELDGSERTNLAQDHPHLVRRMEATLEQLTNAEMDRFLEDFEQAGHR